MKWIYPVSLAMALVACQSTSPRNAVLGVATSVPTEDLAREMGLDFQVRQQGRLVKTVNEKSAAHAAGIRSGDVLLQLGEVVLYSQDDIDDFVSVHAPGDEVRALLVRSDSHEREELAVTLDAGSARVEDGVDWQYASLAQLPGALEQARAEKKKVLVGLSGAET